MELRKTLILSVFLHISFFAAAFLLSADLLSRYDSIPRSSSKILNEKVFFVELTVGIDSRNLGTNRPRWVVPTYRENIASSGNAKSAVETKKLKPKKSLQIRAENNPVIVGIDSRNRVVSTYRDVQRKAASVDPMRKQSFLSHGVETDVASKNNNYLNTQEERANNVLLTSYKSGGNEVVDISSGGGTTSNVSYDSFSSESRGASESNKGRGVLPAGIFELIRDSIENVKTYPPLARKRGIEGAVSVSFRVNSKGEPQDLKIIKSSGSSILDTATLDTVRKAAPFPYVDSPIEVPIVFRLKN